MLVSNPLRKKGGIFIKKLNIFLMLIITTFIINMINVKAESANFYEGEYIGNIYMSKYQPSTGTTYYQKARFFRKSDTNEYAYCIEPFNFFNEESTYTSTLTPDNLSQDQIDRISKIAYFGYGYENHKDRKWYAITQFMIWQVADPSGEYYFTHYLNGNKVDWYDGEINEINNLVNNYSITPSFSNKEYTIVEDHQLVLEDTNNVLNNFKTNDNLTINGNKLTINNLKKGDYEYTLYKENNNYNKPIIFYQSPTSQNIVKTGDIEPLRINIKVHIKETKIELTKIDKDTQSIIPQGEASLDGAKYNLYDENNNLIQELVIENNQAIIKNIDFGKYYLKEITPGTGYTLDNNVYEIIIDKNNPLKDLILDNKVVAKKITIEKKYGDNYLLKGEKNISFQIYNNKKELINTITTDSKGLVEIILPYGSYEFIQINSTEGYSKVDSFKVDVLDDEDEVIELRDLKIEVPNTHTEEINIFNILIIVLGICIKRYCI